MVCKHKESKKIKNSENNTEILGTVQELLGEAYRVSCCRSYSAAVLLIERSVRVAWSVLSQNGGPCRSCFLVMDESGWNLAEQL